MPDAYLKRLFASQVPEARSHVQMGRFTVERFVATPVDMDLCRKVVAMARQDYNIALTGIADFVLQHEHAAVTPAEQATPANVE